MYEYIIHVYYLQGGNLPHITHEVLQMITTDTLIMQMPLTTVFTAINGMKDFGQGISEFVGLKVSISYSSNSYMY